MARLLAPPPFYGTRYGICVYQMYGRDFVRSASSLTGERVKKDKRFKNTMAWAFRLADASRLASAVYALLPPYRRKFPLYRKLTGKAMRLLRNGMGEGGTVVELLIGLKLPKRKAKKITGESLPAEERNGLWPGAHRVNEGPTPGLYAIPRLRENRAETSGRRYRQAYDSTA